MSSSPEEGLALVRHGGEPTSDVPDPFEGLRPFRTSLYGCFGRRADALFELSDAVLAAGSVSLPVHLSLSPVHRRGWGSLYAALSKGRLDEDGLKDLLAGSFPRDDHADPPVYAMDVSS